jgi:nicotinate dehydrogenase subunit B
VKVPAALTAHPLVSHWLRVHPDGRVVVHTGKVELGQGILTALTAIAAEELRVDPSCVVVAAASTSTAPDEGFTAGSMSVAESGTAVRLACATLRCLALEHVAGATGSALGDLAVVDGTIRHADGTRHDGYGRLPLDLDVPVRTSAPTTLAAATALPRVDLADKVLGRPRFLHDLAPPGMVHGRVVRPSGPGARLLTVDDTDVRRLPGVLAVVRDGDFLAVVADDETAAERAAARLAGRATWEPGPSLPPVDAMDEWLRRAPSEPDVVQLSDPPPRPGAVHATYAKGMTAHASIAPSCAIAQDGEQGLTVWSHTQGIYPLRAAIAGALLLEPAEVTVHHVEGAGCYGHNAADDVALDAAMLAQHVPGRPVRVQWSRADELGWAPFGPAMVAEVSATVTDGRISDWTYDVWSNGHAARPGYAGVPGLLATAHVDGAAPLPAAVDPASARGHGTARNAVPAYDLERVRTTAHRVLDMPVRTSALRSLGSFFNVFAIESFMDELATAAGVDPLAFRLDHLSDARGRAVLEEAARHVGSERSPDTGVGLAFARYKNRGAWCAVAAEVEAVEQIRVRRLVVAVDVGRVISPDGTRNQIEGGAVQATSWATREQVRWDGSAITSTSWETYPILRFSEVPAVEVHLLDRLDEPSLGAGEAVQAPTAAAIANAVHDALGVRVRRLPITTEAVIAAIEATHD